MFRPELLIQLPEEPGTGGETKGHDGGMGSVGGMGDMSFPSSPVTPVSPLSAQAQQLQEETKLLSPRNGSQPEMSRCGKVLYQSSMNPSLPFLWKRGEKLGQGTFGEVYMGLNQVTGELFGVKQVPIAPGVMMGDEGGGHQDDAVAALQREISIMRELDHAHIVRYLGTETGTLESRDHDEGRSEREGPRGVRAPHVFIFLEYVPGGSLRGMLKQFGKFAESVIRRYTRQILLGVDYLHARGFIHRDIKGANVLVTEAGIAKLADFGCSKQLQGVNTASLDESLKTIRGSIPWMAPEVIRQAGAGPKADIWSVGATVIEMATANHPWPDLPDNLAALFHVATAKKPPEFPKDISPELRELLNACFQLDPDLRPPAQRLLRVPFLDQVRCSCGCEGGGEVGRHGGHGGHSGHGGKGKAQGAAGAMGKQLRQSADF